jgi:hypothetical protein
MKKNTKIKLSRILPEKISGNERLLQNKLEILREKDYEVQNNYSITGDAPKEFIKVYRYGESKRDNKKTWSLYIAKTARKWYPNESVMEFLLNQLGVVWGLNMAESKLVFCNGQVRFLSKYFLKKDEQLVHCANLYARCFNGTEYIKRIEQHNLEKDINNIQLFKNCVSMVYEQQFDEIFSSFIKMILFDALVGNNDRHFYNYGIIEEITGDSTPRFSPVYDTARGLFWNTSEEKIISLQKNKTEREKFLKKYSENSKPKIGWHGNQDITHFQMVQFIKSNQMGISSQNIKSFYSVDKLDAAISLINKHFRPLMSQARVDIIIECLTLRFNTIQKIIK